MWMLSVCRPHRITTPAKQKVCHALAADAERVTVQTSPQRLSYRLLVCDAEPLTAPARVVWMNRTFADIPESHTACRARAKAWVLKAGYRIVEGKEGQRKRA